MASAVCGDRPAPTDPRSSIRPLRWLFCVIACVSIPLALLFVAPIAPQNGLAWDLLMGVGMLGAGLFIAVPIVSPRAWISVGGNPGFLREILFFHRDISYLAIALVFIHTIGIVIADWTVIEYLKLSAPWSMLAAIIALLLMLGIVGSSVYRIKLNIRYKSWRIWHVGLSTVTIALMTFHILDVGYFVNSPLKKAIFVVLAGGPALVTFGIRSRGRSRSSQTDGHRHDAMQPASGRRGARQFSFRVVTLLVILWMSSIFIFAVPKPESRAEQQSIDCRSISCELP